MHLYGGAGRVTAESGFIPSLATDGTSVFWIIQVGDSDEKAAPYSLRRWKRGSKITTEIARPRAKESIAVLGSRIYWPTESGLASIDKTTPGTPLRDPDAD